MTTALPHSTLRAILYSPIAGDGTRSAVKLLTDRGDQLSTATSIESALDSLTRGQRADLLLLDSPADREALLARVAALPAPRQPRRVVAFSDESTPTAASTTQVLIKPLHVHGLLKVLKQLEAKR